MIRKAIVPMLLIGIASLTVGLLCAPTLAQPPAYAQALGLQRGSDMPQTTHTSTYYNYWYPSGYLYPNYYYNWYPYNWYYYPYRYYNYPYTYFNPYRYYSYYWYW